MSRSKKIFTAFAVVFFLFLFYVSYDISTRTTFPGSKSQLKDRLNDRSDRDSLSYDSVKMEITP